MFFGKFSSVNSSEDAKTFAPCFRTAKKSFNFVFCADIVFAVSVFLCLIFALSLFDIIGLIILSIIIILKGFLGKKRTPCRAF